MIAHDQDDATINEAVGRAVRTQRLNLGITQQQLADALGMAKSVLSRYESGERRWTIALLLRAAHALHQPLTALVPQDVIVAPPPSESTSLFTSEIDHIALVLHSQPHLVPTVASLLETLLTPASASDYALDA